MLVTTGGASLSAFVVSMTASEQWLHLAVLALWAFGGGLLVAIGDVGDGGSTVGVQATMAFVLLGRFAENAASAGKVATAVAAGGAVQVVLVLVLIARWPPALALQRRAAADAYACLAEVARAGPASWTLRAGLALDRAEELVWAPVLLCRADAGRLLSLVDQGRRLRVELMTLEPLAGQLGRLAPGETTWPSHLAGALDAATDVLGKVAPMLDRSGDAGGTSLDAVLERISAAATGLAAARDQELGSSASSPAAAAVAAALEARLPALGGQLRAVMRLAAGTVAAPVPLSGPRDRLPLRASGLVRSHLATLRASMTLRSTAFRHALRLAAAAVLAEGIASPGAHAHLATAGGRTRRNVHRRARSRPRGHRPRLLAGRARFARARPRRAPRPVELRGGRRPVARGAAEAPDQPRCRDRRVCRLLQARRDGAPSAIQPVERLHGLWRAGAL